MKHTAFGGIVLGALACVAVLCAAIEEGAAKGRVIRLVVHEIQMTANDKFDPPAVTIKKGEQVKFINNSGKTHTATSDDIKTGNPKDTFNTGRVANGQSVILNFNEAGTYAYHCEFHGPMKGTITVE
jgi:plastocyanin